MNIQELRLIIAKYNSRVVLRESGSCIECTSHYKDRDGYSIASVDRKPIGLHRLVYEWVTGCSAKGLLVIHSCDNPACVNPDHLRTGTHQDNKNDAVNRKRIAIGSGNGNSKLTEADVAEIICSNLTQQELANMYGVHKQTIGHIKRGFSWGGGES